MTRIRTALRILMSALREIFDEAAYTRFLQRTNMATSRRAYAAFCRERESSQARKMKCC
jgi:hypothetical protein